MPQYAYRDESGWHSVSIPSAPTYNVFYVSLVVDSQDNPHIMYAGGGYLNHAFLDASGWHIEAAVPGGAYCNAAIDPLDVIHVSHLSGGLHYAVWNGSSWTNEMAKADPDSSADMFSFVVLSADGTPHLTFGHDQASAREVWYVAKTDGVWSESLVQSGWTIPRPALALDPNGDPIVSGSDTWGMIMRYLDRTPPAPSPPVWAVAPTQIDDSQITMEASLCEDYYREVEYLFEETMGAPGATDGTWQESASYTDGGLVPGNSYCYRVRARDRSVNANETEWSEVKCVLLSDSTPPQPDPAEWEQIPYLSTETSATMEAMEATDPSGVEYYFEETSGNPGGDDSAWQSSASYVDTDLTAETDYCYRCRTRDKATSQNIGDWSPVVCLSDDVAVPAPSPPSWNMYPYTVPSGGKALYMAVNPCSDASQVEYYFEETSHNPGGNDSGWQLSAAYTDSGLQEDVQYCYRVKARDRSLSRNETAWTDTRCRRTLDTTPPTPNPLAFSSPPRALGEGSIAMSAALATDANGVEYSFEESTGHTGGSASGWQVSPEFLDWGLEPNTKYTYRVKARDKSSNYNETDWSQAISTTTRTMPLSTQAPAIAWKGFTNCADPAYPNPWPELRDIAVTPKGVTYAVGEVGWNHGTAEWMGVTLVSKWESDGSLAWNRVFELPDQYCHPRAATCDAAGYLYVAGAWSPPGGYAWPGWFLARISPDGNDVSTYSSDEAWVVLYSVDIDAEGYAYICGNSEAFGWYVGKFDFSSASLVWTRSYSTTPSTDNIERRAFGVLGLDGYYVAKNLTVGGLGVSLMVRHDLSTGLASAYTVHDFAEGLVEQVTDLAVDQYGNIVAAVWALETNVGYIVKLDAAFRLQWGLELANDNAPYLSMRRVTTGPDWTIYAVGREGENAGWWENSENSHAVVFCVTGDGNYLWDDVFDAGGPDEKEWGVADGVACSPDGTRTYVGASLSYSETDWQRSLSVLAYGKTIAGSASVFRVAADGSVFADGSVYGSAFKTGAADVAEWVPVSAPVEPGDVLELDPNSAGFYRKATGRCSLLVAGVVSSQPGISLGSAVGVEDRALLALSGIVPVKVTNEGGPIQPGDLLISSSTPGYAMRWAGPGPCPCALAAR